MPVVLEAIMRRKSVVFDTIIGQAMRVYFIVVADSHLMTMTNYKKVNWKGGDLRTGLWPENYVCEPRLTVREGDPEELAGPEGRYRLCRRRPHREIGEYEHRANEYEKLKERSPQG